MSEIDNTNKRISALSFNLLTAELTPVDGIYGPWNSLNEMVLKLNGLDTISEEDYNAYINKISAGVTVGVLEDGEIVEYWKPVEGQGFVKKTKDLDDLDIVVAQALCDLNDRVTALEERIDELTSSN